MCEDEFDEHKSRIFEIDELIEALKAEQTELYELIEPFRDIYD